MCLQTVPKEMRGWAGQEIHRYFPRLQAIWLIPMRFTGKYLYDLYQEQLLAGGMVQRLSPFGPTKCSCAWGDAVYHPLERIFVQRGTKQSWKARLRA